MIKKLTLMVGALALIATIGVLSVGTTFAQTPTQTPTPNSAPLTDLDGMHGFGFGGGDSVATFDAMATALNLTPTQLFEQLHSGKTLDAIAQAQGVDLTKVQEAAKAARTQAMKDNLAQAVKDGTMTQAQADWILQGIENGWGFGHGHGGRGGMRGLGNLTPPSTPTTPTATSGTAS